MERKSFWGNDKDYGLPYNHRYEEENSDRGASDEGWETQKSKADSHFRMHGIKLW